MSEKNEQSIERIGKHYENIEEFYNSDDFKTFEKNSLAKFVEIAKKLKLYPKPDLADFAGAYTLDDPDQWGKRTLEFRSADLADKLNFKLVPYLWLRSFGSVRLCEQEIGPKNPKAKVKKTVQVLSFDCNWMYRHYGGGGNGTDIFWAAFDLNGKLSAIRSEVLPKKLEELKNNSDSMGIFDKAEIEKAEALLPEYNKKSAAFKAKVRKLIDKDNLVAVAERREKSAGHSR